jgi:hypothetical protein
MTSVVLERRRDHPMPDSQHLDEYLEAVYAQLNPQQRITLAQEFQRGFRQSGNPHAATFLSMNPKKVTPEQLAAMHQHAREEQPAVLGRVMQHSIVSVLLGNFGAAEIANHVSGR